MSGASELGADLRRRRTSDAGGNDAADSTTTTAPPAEKGDDNILLNDKNADLNDSGDMDSLLRDGDRSDDDADDDDKDPRRHNDRQNIAVLLFLYVLQGKELAELTEEPRPG